MPVEDIAEEDLHLEVRRPVGRRLPLADGGLRPWIEWFGLGRLIAGAATVVVLVAVGWWLLRSPQQPTESALPLATAPPTSTATLPATTAASGPIIVHVAGAVTAPGVYELAAGARVEAAIQAAGGPQPTADPGALNLAAVVADGERVYVPAVGEAPLPPPPAAGSTAVASGPVDLNHADAEQLDGLPGIGPATAAAIVDHRAQHGPFATVDDLEAVRGIGPAKLEAIRQLVRV